MLLLPFVAGLGAHLELSQGHLQFLLYAIEVLVSDDAGLCLALFRYHDRFQIGLLDSRCCGLDRVILSLGILHNHFADVVECLVVEYWSCE